MSELESVSNPSETKMPTTMRIRHGDVPEMEHAAPGDEVEFHVKGHVHSNRAKDKYGDGEAEVDVHHIEHMKSSKKAKKNTASMGMDELKDKISKE